MKSALVWLSDDLGDPALDGAKQHDAVFDVLVGDREAGIEIAAIDVKQRQRPANFLQIGDRPAEDPPGVRDDEVTLPGRGCQHPLHPGRRAVDPDESRRPREEAVECIRREPAPQQHPRTAPAMVHVAKRSTQPEPTPDQYIPTVAIQPEAPTVKR